MGVFYNKGFELADCPLLYLLFLFVENFKDFIPVEFLQSDRVFREVAVLENVTRHALGVYVPLVIS